MEDTKRKTEENKRFMIHLYILRKSALEIIQKLAFSVSAISFCLFFFLLFSFVSCGKTEKLSRNERLDLEYFLNFFLFENYGAFVLFGSKPIAEMTLINSVLSEKKQENYLLTLSVEEKENWDHMLTQGETFSFTFKRNPYDGWKVFEKLQKRIKRGRFRLIHWPDTLFLIDTMKVSECLQQHYELFKDIYGKDFQHEELVLQLETPHHPFWETILFGNEHTAMGILYGFGEENATNFSSELQEVSTTPVSFGEGNVTHFTIPLFGCEKDDKVVAKYQKEKNKIEKIYQSADLINITIERMSSN